MARGSVTVAVLFDHTLALANRVEAGGSELVKSTGGAIRQVAQERVRVDTGALRDSIQDAYAAGGLSGTVTTGTDHDLVNEFGSVHMPAQPYFWPAVERARADVWAPGLRTLIR